MHVDSIMLRCLISCMLRVRPAGFGGHAYSMFEHTLRRELALRSIKLRVEYEQRANVTDEWVIGVTHQNALCPGLDGVKCACIARESGLPFFITLNLTLAK